MKLHAGSLYSDYLVLYGHTDNLGNRVIKVPDRTVQWDIYCNDVEFEPIDSERAKVTYDGVTYEFEYQLSQNPMKDLGFSD